MKIRLGFVSNSSSSSFCIYKKLMTEEQIKEFRELVDGRDDEETSIGEDGDYFIGTLSMHNNSILMYLKQNFKKGEWANYC